MKEIIKVFEEKKVRCFIKNGDPYFSISDICNILEISNSRQASSYLNKDDVSTNDIIDKLGRKQTITIINEGALYQLIFRSRKEEAKDFQKWVTHEVLPSIRKTGKYSIPENIKQLSTEKRNMLTDEWKAHGITEPHEYIQLTLQEYKGLGFEKAKRKKDLNKKELLFLSALESMETLKLFENENITGFNQCKDSLQETTKVINKLKELT